MAEKKPVGMSWESFADALVNKAMAQGEFANLPGAGQPIPDLEQPYREDWWLTKTIKRENLSIGSEWIDIRVDMHKTLERIKSIRSESTVRDELESLNARIRKVNSLATSGPGTSLSVLDIPTVLDEWRKSSQH